MLMRFIKIFFKLLGLGLLAEGLIKLLIGRLASLKAVNAMLARSFKVIFKLLRFELLSMGLVRLLTRRANGFSKPTQKKLSTWIFRGMILLLLIGLGSCTLLFSLLTLALYLNTVCGSSYQGFLLVSGGCVTLLLLLLLSWLAWSKKNQ